MKKIVSLLLCIIVTLSMFVTVNAANELASAKSYTLGSSKSGSIAEGNESDVYKFNLLTSGVIKISFSADMERVDLKLYDSTGKEIWNDRPTWNSTTEEISYSKELVLCKGDYYISISKSWGKWDGDYTVNITETAIYESFSEDQNGSNNSTKTSNPISHGNEYIGCIAINDNTDVYNISLSSSGKLHLALASDMERVDLKLYDSNGKELWNDRPTWNNTTEEISYQKDLYLCKGKYFFSFSKSWGKCEGSYSYKFLFTSADESFAEEQETVDTLKTAKRIVKNQKYNGFLALNDNVDIYGINIENSSLNLCLSANLERVDLKIYDSTGKEIWSDRPTWNNITEEISYSKEIKFAPGFYHLSVSKSWGKCEGKYTFYFSDGTPPKPAPTPIPVITVLIDGVPVVFDQPPVLENGRTLVPLRAIFEALGATVEWNNNTQTVTATKGGTKISLQIGSTQMYVNGTVKTLDVPAKLINSRTLVPVRAVSEAFGCKVDWDQNTYTVLITK